MLFKKVVFIILIAVTFIFLFPVVSSAQGDIIILYGDSMFSGDTFIPADLVSMRQGDAVIERGHGGWASASGKRFFKNEVVPFKPTIIVIDFGINDAIREGNHNRISLSQYKKNMNKIVRKSAELGAMVIVVTPGPVNYDKRGDNWKDSEVNAYRETAISAASKYSAAVVDAYALLKNAGNYLIYLQNDGLHYNEAGSKLITDQINLTINSINGSR